MIWNFSFSISYTQRLINRLKFSFAATKILAILLITIVTFSSIDDSGPSTTSAFLKNNITSPTTSIAAGEWVPDSPSLFGWNIVSVLETGLEETQSMCGGEITLDENETHLPIYRWLLVDGDEIGYQQELTMPDGTIKTSLKREQLEPVLSSDLSTAAGVWKVRVRAFGDKDLDGFLDETERFSKWSDDCEITVKLPVTEEVVTEDPAPASEEDGQENSVVAEKENLDSIPATNPLAKIYKQEAYNAAIEIYDVADYDEVKYLINYTHLFEGEEVTEGVEDALIVGDQTSLEKTNIYFATCSADGICTPHLGIIPESIKLNISLYQAENIAKEFTVDLTGGWEEEQQ